MKKLTSLIFIGLIFCTQLVLAHDNHATISDPDMQKIGKEAAANLTTQDPGLGFGKLPASWNDVPLNKAKIHKKYHGYTVVAVTNDIEKKTIFFVVSDDGDVYDANFTGEFKNLK